MYFKGKIKAQKIKVIICKKSTTKIFHIKNVKINIKKNKKYILKKNVFCITEKL